MSLIACTNTCVYQEEGTCRLEQAASSGQAPVGSGCIHFVERGGTAALGYGGVNPARLPELR